MDEHARILIVDDYKHTLFALRSTFEKLGDRCEIVTVRNGHEALDKARATAFDLVITDLRMPDMGGIELTRKIKALNPGTSIIWVTTHGCRWIEADTAQLSVYRCYRCPDRPKIGKVRQIAQEALEGTDRKPVGRAYETAE